MPRKRGVLTSELVGTVWEACSGQLSDGELFEASVGRGQYG